jgi:hypothetical protein
VRMLVVLMEREALRMVEVMHAERQRSRQARR